FDLGADFQRAQDLVAAGHNLLTIAEALCNFNIGRTLDAGLHRLEIDLFHVLIDYEHALNFLLALGVRSRRWRGLSRRFLPGQSRALRIQLALGADRQSLN